MKKLLILIGLTMAAVPAFATSQNNGVSYKANEEDVDSAVWGYNTVSYYPLTASYELYELLLGYNLHEPIQEEDHVTGNYSFAKGGKVTKDWIASYLDGTHDTKTVWLLAPGGAVTNCNGVTVANGSLPAGVGYGLENGKLSGKYWPNLDWILTEDKNSTVKITFYAGGPGVPGQQVLVAVNPPTQAQQEVTQPGFASGGPVIPYEQTSIPDLKKNLGTDGWAYAEEPNGKLLDVTPTASGPMYGFPWPNVTAYALSIVARSSTTNANLYTSTPTFCVGQHVSFVLNGLPGFVDAVGRWNLPGTFVNEQWQNYITDPTTGLPTFYGSVNYREDDNLLNISGQNVGTSCWYYDKLNNGTVSMHVNLHFSNGQYVSVAADGNFSVFKPGVSFPFTENETIVPMLTNSWLELGNGQESHGDGSYFGCPIFDAFITSKVPFTGVANWTQLIRRSVTYPFTGTGGQYTLDTLTSGSYNESSTSIVADPHADDPTIAKGAMPYYDNPGIYCYILTVSVSATIKDDFQTYLQFTPDGDSIPVTLGIVTYEWGATETDASIMSNTTAIQPAFQPSIQFPEWPHN